MGIVIGMDEAGYGPHLGPLVVTATVWEVPGSPQKTDFWEAFESILSATAPTDDRLHIADSKAVYSPQKGLGALERSVLAALGLGERVPGCFHELLRELSRELEFEASLGHACRSEPWYANADLTLPTTELGATAVAAAEGWRDVCRETGICLKAVKSDVVATQRWNRLTRDSNNKAMVLSQMSLELLRKVWDPDDTTPTLVIADKHGGRNYYGGLLTEILDGRMPRCGKETLDVSVYKVGRTELRFEARAERHFPVAVASMISKYVRELAMELFNRFWVGHMPALKPTKGYHTDSWRFRNEIAELQAQLAIPDDLMWRER